MPEKQIIPEMDELLTRQEVADYLKVSQNTADKFIHNKNFNGLVYIGRNVRILKSKLIEYIESKRQYKI